MKDLKVIGFDWFQYTNPPLPLLTNQYVQYSNGRYVYEVDKIQTLAQLSKSIADSCSDTISFIGFMRSFS